MTYVVNTFKNKKLFKVDLNWKGEVHKCYTQASTPEQAMRFALQQLSVKLKLNSSKPLLQYFDGSKANYEIKEVVKNEVDNRA